MQDWKSAAEVMARTTGMSWRRIAKELGVSKSTVSDHLRKVFGNAGKNDSDFSGPKILFYDIETAPMKAHLWSMWQQGVGLNQIESDWHMLSFCCKWAHSDEIFYYDQRSAKDIEDDYELVLKLWHFLNEADVVVGHNCVEVSTPVLTQDLKWVPVGELKVGDKIVGFDEGKNPYSTCRTVEGDWVGVEKHSGRNVRAAVVTEHSIEEKDCVRVNRKSTRLNSSHVRISYAVFCLK